MPICERSRDSCSCRVRDSLHNIPRDRKILYISILVIVLLGLLALLATGIAYAHSTTTTAHKLALKARTATTTEVVYATVTVTQAPAPIHTSVFVYSNLNAGEIVGICFAVLGGFLLVIILLTCLARCLVKRLDRLIGAGDRPAGNWRGARYSPRYRPRPDGQSSAGEQAGGNYSLRDLTGGGDSAGGGSNAEHAAGGKFGGDYPHER